MDLFTWGFISIVLIFMGAKVFYEFRMYKNSVYKMIYSSFIEYRSRRKSIEGMSESYNFRDAFGPHRIIFSALEDQKISPASFMTVFLTSGCYVFGICTKEPAANSIARTKEFFSENVQKKLEGTVYDSEKVPVTFRLLLPDSLPGKISRDKGVIRRQELMEELTRLHKEAPAVWSAEDVDHLFRTIAAQALKTEEESSLSSMLTKDM